MSGTKMKVKGLCLASVCGDLCVVSGLPVLYEQHRPVEPSKRRTRSQWLACQQHENPLGGNAVVPPQPTERAAG